MSEELFLTRQAVGEAIAETFNRCPDLSKVTIADFCETVLRKLGYEA